MIKRLFEVIKGGVVASPTIIHHVFRNNVFSLDAPENFTRNDDHGMFQLVEANNLAAITASAYAKDDGVLDEFCEYRFSLIEDFYTPVSELRTFEAANALGKIQEFEGIWPGENEPTYYVVLAVGVGDIYISLSIITERDHYEAHRSQYDAIFASIRPGAE